MRTSSPRGPTRLLLLPALAALLLAGPASAAETIAGLKPVEPQPAAGQLTPGLAVQYAYGIVNSIAEFAKGKFEAGPPLPNLDYKSGYGTVLTSKAQDGVMAVISGLIRFEKPGTYGFDVTSNDGVRLEIGGKLVFEDDTVHSDETSPRTDVKIDQAGWYPITVHYFEKRNTATLIVRWLEPGQKGKPQPVPAKALAHIKK